VNAEPILAKAERFNRMTAEALKRAEPVYTIPIAETRRKQAEWARARRVPDADWLLPADAPGLRFHHLPLAAPRAVYLHLHGGGWVLGGADHQDPLLDHLRRRVGLAVLSLDYRLAPEHPFPAGLDDTTAALRWLLDGGLSRFGCERLVIGGESAGAALALGAMLRLSTHREFTRIRLATLHYGTYEMAGRLPLLEDQPFLDAPLVAWYRRHYAGAVDWSHPELNPLWNVLPGMPPAHIVVGSADPVLSHSEALAAQWQATGSAASLHVLPGGLHGLLELQTPLTVTGREVVAKAVLAALTQG